MTLTELPPAGRPTRKVRGYLGMAIPSLCITLWIKGSLIALVCLGYPHPVCNPVDACEHQLCLTPTSHPPETQRG